MRRGDVALETVYGSRMRRFVFASDYEALQAENAKLRRKVGEYIGEARHYRHQWILSQEIALDALAENKALR